MKLIWKLGYSDNREQNPDEFVDAFVPSNVQLVWKEAKNMPDYNFGKNYLEYKWMEDKFWHYKTEFYLEKREGYEPSILFKGIDYRYTILINGNMADDSEGMFTPVNIPLSEYEGKHVVCEVIIHPIPKIKGVPEGRGQAAMSVKPAVSYGWDWHPRLVPSGLYDDAELQYLPVNRITECDFTYTLSDSFDRVDFTAKVKASVKSGFIKVEIADSIGKIITSATAAVTSDSTDIELSFDNPKLWWCARQGKQYRYNYIVTLLDSDGKRLDIKSRKVGFRRARLVMNNDDWSSGEFPMTQAYYPITMELNGRRIFCKGTNFLPTDIFPSRMTEKVYRDNLTLALECNMNILRMWGGGLVNKEPFFDICDEMGLMVWQEFPLACNNYPDDRHCLSVLDRESVSIIKRLKSHPSVVLWCGGNELFNGWSGMTNQSLALRLLDKNCYENDPTTPFIMTSPLYGMGHGCYLNLVSPDREAVTDFVEKYRTAYTEFGAPSPAPFDYIKQYCPKEEWYKTEDGTSWVDHHALYAWNGRNTWFNPSEIEAFYGKQDSLEKLIDCGLELQGESYKGMFEEARRKWSMTSMAINWCFNEPWPCFANNSLVMYPTVKRPAFDAVKAALRDRMLSAKLHHLRYRRGETVNTEIYMLNDLPEGLIGCAYSVYYIANGKRTDVGSDSFDKAEPLSSAKLRSFSFTVPTDAVGRLTLCVKADKDELSSQYILYIIG